MKKGTHCSEETKEKMRLKLKGRKLPEAQRLKVIKTLHHASGKGNPAWKGGRTISSEGYIWIKKLDHPYKNTQGYVPEHRLKVEENIGRFLLSTEKIHHINGNKKDNRIENLLIINAHDHAMIHWGTDEAKKKQSDFMKEVRSKKYWSTKKVN